jgi:formate dehydrogenase iron-sulfur subunit
MVEPAAAVRKCDMCYERQSAGKQTACAEACPTGATVRRPRCADRGGAPRLAEKPDQYYSKIYGLRKWAAPRCCILSAVPFEQIGLRTNVPQEPLPELTWRVLELVPDVVSTGSVLLGGIWWITNRRAKWPQGGTRDDRRRKLPKITVWRAIFAAI